VPIDGGRNTLQLQINVLTTSSCEGCRFHEFPYTFTSIVRNEKKEFDQVTIDNMDQLYSYVDLIKQETLEKTDSSNSVLKDIFYQLPFFACTNMFFSNQSQKDIAKYIYCEDTKTPPYSGSYGDIPQIWKEKHFLIKQALSILYQDKRDKIKRKNGSK